MYSALQGSSGNKLMYIRNHIPPDESDITQSKEAILCFQNTQQNNLHFVKDQKARLVLIYFPNFTTIYTIALEDLWPKCTRIYYYVQMQ
jgi:hypothetical protein